MDESAAQDLFESLLARGTTLDPVAFDDLIAEHSAHEVALRRLREEYEGARRGLHGAPGGKDAPDPAAGVSFFGRQHRQAPELLAGASAGQELAGFRLVDLIGQGGMGQVWRAEQVSIRRQVALKLVRPEMVTPKTLDLFAREARAGARFRHPGIVDVIDHGTSDGIAWIAMEFVEGAWTLRDFLNDVTTQEELPVHYYRDVARFGALLADAMEAVHTQGVIHRDLKPQNVLIAPDDTPKITDFGLARITAESALSMTGDFAGTYYYMSPEQVAARRMGIDHRTDVFSLGIVLYEMLSGRRPFEGDTTHQIAAQIVTKDPPNLRVLRSRIPRDLAVITGKCLEKDPDRRFSSMGDLAADIRRHLNHEPIHATPPGRVRKAWLWAQRNPTKSVAGGVGAVALAAISGLSLNLAKANTSLVDTNTNLEAATSRANQERDRAAELRDDAVARADALWTIQELADFRRESSDLEFAYALERSGVEWWLEKASRLVDGRPADEPAGIPRRPGLADHQRLLAEIRESATAEELDADGQQVAWTFDDREKRWWNEQLTALEADLLELRERVETAERGATSPEARELWAEAQTAIRAHPKYAGLELGPQLFLLPLGADPDSGLWEFAHLLTGEPAARGKDGKLVLKDETGLVFVLLPGGRVPVENGREPGPLNEVDLVPFLLSKYEMTQGQWSTISEGWTGRYAEHESALAPADRVSWDDCQAHLGELPGWIGLPSEAQWEYGCRAETKTPWWPGADETLLRGAANIRFDDKRIDPVAVGTLQANPFGLHDVLGNLLEWCQDSTNDDLSPRPRDGLRDEIDSAARVYRGGGFYAAASSARSGVRDIGPPGDRFTDIGLRPSQGITP